MNDKQTSTARGIAWGQAAAIEVLTFGLGGETFAVEAGLVQEILDPLPETRVPGADPCVPAVINFRGQVIPLADIRVAFGMEHAGAGQDDRIIVLELDIFGEATLVGIATDRVNEVTTLLQADSEPPPTLGLRYPRALVRALVRRGGDVVLIPDLFAIFDPLVGGSGDPAAVAA